jgi:hypothetical protein
MSAKIDTPGEVAAYEEYAARWTAIIAEGEQNNWLAWTNDYEGSHLELVHPRQLEMERARAIERDAYRVRQALQRKREERRKKNKALSDAVAEVARLRSEL